MMQEGPASFPAETAGGLFERTPLGFDLDTPPSVLRDAVDAVEGVLQNPGLLLEWAGGPGLDIAIFAAGLLLLRLVFELLERRSRGWRFPWAWLRRRCRRSPSLLLVLESAHRSLPPLLGLALLQLWIGGGGGQGLPAQAAAQLLGLWAAGGISQQLLRTVARVLGPPAASSGIIAALRILTTVAVVWLAGWTLLVGLGYREDGVAFWVTLGHLVLVLGVYGVFASRGRVLALFDSLPEAARRPLLPVIRAVHPWVVHGSVVIALLWVAGYRSLAQVFLGRSWAVIGAGLAALLGSQAVRQALPRWITAPEGLESERDALLRATGRVVDAAAWVALGCAALWICNLWEAWWGALEQDWLRIGEFQVRGGGIFLGTVAVPLVGRISDWLQCVASLRLYPSLGIRSGEAYSFNRLLHYSMLVLAGLVVITNLGLPPAGQALMAGGLGVGVGLGLQKMVANLASGLSILIGQQVRQGDLISIGDHTGFVRRVDLRCTTVTTRDGIELIIPNTELLESTVVNWTHDSPVVRTRIPFSVAYSTDVERVRGICLDIAAAHAEVLDEPAPELWIRALGENGLELELLVWLDHRTSMPARVTSGLYDALIPACREAGIEFPFPQRQLHLPASLASSPQLPAPGRRSAEGSPPPGEP